MYIWLENVHTIYQVHARNGISALVIFTSLFERSHRVRWNEIWKHYFLFDISFCIWHQNKSNAINRRLPSELFSFTITRQNMTGWGTTYMYNIGECPSKFIIWLNVVRSFWTSQTLTSRWSKIAICCPVVLHGEK